MITDQIASRSGKDFSSNPVILLRKNGSRSGGSVTYSIVRLMVLEGIRDAICMVLLLMVPHNGGACPSGANYRSEYTAITQTFLIRNLILKSCIRNFFSFLLDLRPTTPKKVLSPSNEERGGILQSREKSLEKFHNN
jgi:hypothetical protein